MKAFFFFFCPHGEETIALPAAPPLWSPPSRLLCQTQPKVPFPEPLPHSLTAPCPRGPPPSFLPPPLPAPPREGFLHPPRARAQEPAESSQLTLRLQGCVKLQLCLSLLSPCYRRGSSGRPASPQLPPEAAALPAAPGGQATRSGGSPPTPTDTQTHTDRPTDSGPAADSPARPPPSPRRRPGPAEGRSLPAPPAPSAAHPGRARRRRRSRTRARRGR